MIGVVAMAWLLYSNRHLEDSENRRTAHVPHSCSCNDLCKLIVSHSSSYHIAA
jgi:hypothetical protein